MTWQKAAGDRWAALHARTNVQLGPLGLAALAMAAPSPGERVLDVGCGAGESTLELAELVGPSGRVIGVDLSGALLEAARARVDRVGLGNVQLVLGNAAVERFTEPFDLVFSRFGVMYFEDSVAAFANLRAALRPGGRLGFVSWQSLAANPWADTPLAAVRTLRPKEVLPDPLVPGKPGPFNLSDATLVHSILDRAGYSEIEIVSHEAPVLFGGSLTLEDAVEYALQIGPAARFMAEAELERDPRVRKLLADALAPFATPEGVYIPARTLIVTARREA
jgi:SAM-dependent methyltransferase